MSHFGEKCKFAIEVGEFWADSNQLRRVDIWADCQQLTRDDNTAFVPQFLVSVEDDLDQINNGGFDALSVPQKTPRKIHQWLLEHDLQWSHRFPNWGPTTDNVEGHLVRFKEQLLFTFRFWQRTPSANEEAGAVFHAMISVASLSQVLQQTVDALKTHPPA